MIIWGWRWVVDACWYTLLYAIWLQMNISFYLTSESHHTCLDADNIVITYLQNIVRISDVMVTSRITTYPSRKRISNVRKKRRDCYRWYVAAETLLWCHNGLMASQITSLTIVYSTIHSGADQRKHQSFASLAFCDRWIPRTNGQCFHFMTLSWKYYRRSQ